MRSAVFYSAKGGFWGKLHLFPLKTFIRQFANESFLKRWAWLVLLIVAILTLTGGVFDLPLVDRDEPRFSQATIEMMETEQWVIPYFNGEYRFDKPPLTYWWMRVNYWIFGTTEFAARLHSLLAGYFCALAIFGFGCRLYDVRAAFLAGLGWLTCLQVMIHSRMAVADMPLVLAIILVQWATWELLKGRRKVTYEKHEVPTEGGEIREIEVPRQDPIEPRGKFSKWFFVLWFSMGLGFLAKGPLIFAVPLLSWLLWRWVFWRKHKQPWGKLQLLTGSLIALFIVALWGLPALVETSGAFWDRGMGEHVIERGYKSFNDRLVLPIYYPLTAFISLMPWIAFAWWGYVKMRRNWDERAAFLLSWFIAPFLIFTFYSTQLPHYTLPGFAAFFLLLFMPSKEKIETGKWEKRFYWIVNGVWIVVLGAIAYLVLTQNFTGPRIGTLRFILACAAVLWLGLLGVGYSFRKPSVAQMVFALFAIYFGTWGMGKGLRDVSPAVALTHFFEDAPEGTQWRGVIYQEPSLVFYSGDKWKFFGHVAGIQTEQAMLEEAQAPTGVIGLEMEWRLEDFAKTLIGQPLSPRVDHSAEWEEAGYEFDEVYYMEGVNMARMSWVKLIIIPPEERPGDTAE